MNNDTSDTPLRDPFELARERAEREAELEYEMSAAFGPGVEVINVLTGETTITK